MSKFAIIDIETTGGNASNSKITEIAIIIYENGRIIREYESLINPECSVPPEITRITGITTAMLKDAPKFYEVAKEVLEITHDCIFVAHNVNFDYSFIKEEYRSLGYSFSRKRLCTVQLSKKYYPGLRSYSLGNLIKHFGIEVKDRHRAMEDVRATLNIFKRMYDIENDPSRIHKLIKGMLHATKLPTHIQKTDIDTLPEECGVYYMSDEQGRYVYIGKSKNIKERIIQHFNESNFKYVKMLRMVHSIAYTITGSELMACLLESAEIKTHSPEINRAQRNKQETWAIIKNQNKVGFYYYHIKNLAELKGNEEAIHLFRNSKYANDYLNYLIQEYQICPSVNQAKIEVLKVCQRYPLGFCRGVCKNLESKETYNERFLEMHKKVNRFFTKDMIITDQGKNHIEKSVILVQNGFCTAYGIVEMDQQFNHLEELKSTLTPYKGNIESNGIIQRFINSKLPIKIQFLDNGLDNSPEL